MNAHTLSRTRAFRRSRPAGAALAALWIMALMPPLVAQAQMQIPNPLLQPPRPKSSAAVGLPPALEPIDRSELPARPVSLDSFGSPNGTSGNRSDDTLREIRERFSNFYVSTIMGSHAVLRSNAKTVGMLAAPSNAVGTASAQPLPASMGTAGRSETFLLADSEPLEFVGEAVTLVPRITANRVYIYYIDNTKKAANKSQRNPIVFIGEVESSEPLPTATPILEKPDAAYRQSISTQSKSTSSVNSSSSQTPASPTLTPLN